MDENGTAGSEVRAVALDACPACGSDHMAYPLPGCTHAFHRTGDGVVLSSGDDGA